MHNLDVDRDIVRLAEALQPVLAEIRLRDVRLADHISKTFGSIEDNTNEGKTATTRGRKANFYRIARDSGGELEGQVRRAERNGYIAKQERIGVGIILNKVVFLLNQLVKRWETE